MNYKQSSYKESIPAYQKRADCQKQLHADRYNYIHYCFYPTFYDIIFLTTFKHIF